MLDHGHLKVTEKHYGTARTRGAQREMGGNPAAPAEPAASPPGRSVMADGLRRRPPGRPSSSFPPIARCRPVADWPAADQIAWQRACDPGGRLTQPGPAAHLAIATKKKRSTEWGRFLSYLDVAGDLDPAETPDRRLTRQRLGGYIMSLRGRVRASSTHDQVVDLKCAIRAMCPAEDWSWVSRHPAMPTAAEVAASRRPIDPPDPVELMAAALDQCDAANRQAPGVMASTRYRSGLMIAFNVWATLRRRNLAEMEIGRHLLIGERHMRIVFDDFDQERRGHRQSDPRVPDPLLPRLSRSPPPGIAPGCRRLHRTLDQSGGQTACRGGVAARVRAEWPAIDRATDDCAQPASCTCDDHDGCRPTQSPPDVGRADASRREERERSL